MTRKELIDSILIKAGKDFDWGFGKFEYWDTVDCVEYIPSGDKFFFGNLVYINGSAHYDAPFKKTSNGKYDMSAEDWTEKVNKFQAWIATKQAASFLGRKGGQAKSERKTDASRENGKKGGAKTILRKACEDSRGQFDVRPGTDIAHRLIGATESTIARYVRKGWLKKVGSGLVLTKAGYDGA